MGTKVQRESLLPGYHHSMRDLNEDSSGCSLANSQYYNGFPPRNMADSYLGYEKDLVRRTMLEHEAVFKSQVYELHRLYRIQREMMDELKRKEISRNRVLVGASFSSSPLLSQVTYDEARKWQMPNFPSANLVYDRPSMSVVEDNGHHSPMSSRKGSNSQVGPVPSQNGSCSKDVELLEVKPVKARKKMMMIDLHLPADEYIDTEETVEFKDNYRTSGNSSHLPDGDLKVECQGDSLRISSDFRSSNCLGDLNEPIKKAREANGFAYGYPRDSCNSEFQGQNLCNGMKIPSMEVSLHSGSEREHLTGISQHSDKNGVQKVQSLGVGHYTDIQKSAYPFLQPAKALSSSHLTQVTSYNSRKVLEFPHSGWRERTFIDLEADTSSREVIIHQSHLESSVASNAHSLHPCNPPASVQQWNHLNSSRGNSSFGFFPREVGSGAAQIHPFQNFSNPLSGSDSQKQGFLMDKSQSDNNSRFNMGFGNSRNGFYLGSSSASKEIQSNFLAVGYGYVNGRSEHSPGNIYQDSYGSEMKPARDVDLNVTVSNVEKGHLAILPWLDSKPACKSEIAGGQCDPMTGCTLNSPAINDDPRNKAQNGLCSENWRSVLCSDNSGTKNIDAIDCSANGKIIGRPAFDEPCRYGDQFNGEKGKGHNVRMFDINVPCDPEAVLSDEDRSTEDQTRTEISAGFRFQIDLNMSVTEDEDCSSIPGSRLNAKVPMIDLEAPAILESDEDDAPEETQKPVEEQEKMAAEAIVTISSACQLRDTAAIGVFARPSSSAESSEHILQWFAETIYVHGENIDQKLDTFLTSKGSQKNNGASSSSSIDEEVDYFEAMTLQLPEVTEDGYMPKSSVPEGLKFEEPSGPALVSGQRPRRGSSRRGRQRRDFQRDILPGLMSLSRHEVTEDIQMFDGFMRAMGITWISSSARRKTGSTRGRRRRHITAIPPSGQHLNNGNGDIEAGLEDRNLTGWGKMTRRPRRQRCPPTGNRYSHTSFAC
ncbi:PREDICTED: uncharacterized protein LOC104824067 [Tarenaya hassleriana]|uniref:uncharacterized protein LOC104824067 n=1 Tax=Tarenaya hassleriana TaxID=28532 RepID=UPI00053C88E7|nr:PREDICTED: uncharacterized protein LOC104824067 [Tarenaya hassleriana]